VRALGAALAAALTLVASGPSATAAPSQQRGRVSLLSQAPWVDAGGEFSLSLHLTGVTDPGSLEIALSTFSRVPSRSAFELTLHNRAVGTLLDVSSSPLSSLGPDQNGNLTIALPLQDPSVARDPRRLFLSREGVYPVRVELRERDGGDVLDRFTTHLLYFPVARTGAALEVGWVLRAHAPPSIATDGTRRLPATRARDLLGMAQALEADPGTPLTVAPTPETLEALSASSDQTATNALATLRRALPRRQLTGASYVPVNLPGMLAGGLDQEAEAERTRGIERATQALRLSLDTETWVTEEPLDDASVAHLRDQGVDQVVVPETSLAPVNLRITLTRPFVVDARQGRRMPAAAADAGLAAHFTNNGSQVLAAHQFLADLAVLYLDQPGGSPRGVVALTPRSWRPSKQFVDTALAGLDRSPILQPVTLATLFGSVDKLRSSSGAPTVRRLAPGPKQLAGATAARAARQRLATFGSILDPGNQVYGLLEEQLLVAQSADLRSSRQRAYLNAVEEGVDEQLGRLQTPADRSITLTAREGQIPVTFRNATGYPVHVVVTVRSDKLEFPGGTRRSGKPPNQVSRRLDLTRRNDTERFTVLARTSGAFPLVVTMESPDGSLIVGNTRLTVRSTAASGVGLFLSGAAGIFLLVWWGRHALRGRRARRLVPA
jgi:uncharacterized protein DUF6049